MKRRAKRRIAALALGSVAALALAEGILRYGGVEVQGAFVWAPSIDVTLAPDPRHLPGVSGPARVRTTADGLRASPRPPGEHFSLLFLGGSTTECLYLDQAETWPELVGARLAARVDRPVWVANAGRSGASARHHPLQLDAVLARQGSFDWIVVLVGINDLGLVLRQGAEYDPHYAERPEHAERLRRRSFQLWRRSSGPWHERTALWHLLQRVALARVEASELQDSAGAIYAEWRAHRRESPERIDELPDLTAALEEYGRNVDALLARCRASGARVLLLTQPVLWREDLEPELEARLWMGGVGRFQRDPGCAYYTSAALARGLRAFDRVLLERGKEPGVVVLDLAAAVASSGANFYDDCHFTEAGAAATARIVAAELVRRPPFAP